MKQQTDSQDSSEIKPIKLHLMTQDNQPYGSARRCCEKCGVMIWGGPPPDGGEWTSDRLTYKNPPPGYICCTS
jgi:hypothetical protein